MPLGSYFSMLAGRFQVSTTTFPAYTSEEEILSEGAGIFSDGRAPRT